jgi:hypothetical protein
MGRGECGKQSYTAFPLMNRRQDLYCPLVYRKTEVMLKCSYANDELYFCYFSRRQPASANA